MLSSEAFEAWCKGIGIAPYARALMDQIRISDPARRVGGGRSNVSGRYPSRKMGVTIQFESHRVELAGIYEMEHDPEVLEFYDQAIQIKLSYEGPGGKRLGVLHTPDFFVIRTTSAGWEEWKTEDDLVQLAKNSPNRYLAGKAASGAAHRVNSTLRTLASIIESGLPVKSTGCTSGISSSSRTTSDPKCQFGQRRRNTYARSLPTARPSDLAIFFRRRRAPPRTTSCSP